MRHRPLLYLVATLCPPLVAQIQPVSTSRIDCPLTITSEHGDRGAAGRELMLDVVARDGSKTQSEVLLVYDPVTGLMLYEHALHLIRSIDACTFRSRWMPGSILHADTDRMARFALGSGPLVIRTSAQRASSLDDAEAKALAELRGYANELGKAPWDWKHDTQVRLVSSIL